MKEIQKIYQMPLSSVFLFKQFEFYINMNLLRCKNTGKKLLENLKNYTKLMNQ